MSTSDQASRQLAAEYSDKAVDYARLWAPVIGPMAESLLEEAPLVSARDVLDVGCGTGGLVPAITRAAPRAAVVGVDLSFGMLALARAGGQGVFASMDAAALAFGSETFDVVVMAFVLFHVPDPARALREVARVLRPQGELDLATWGERTKLPATTVWEEELDRAGAGPDPRDPSVTMEAAMDSPEKLRNLLAMCGYGWVDSRVHTFRTPLSADDTMEIHIRCSKAGRRLRTLPPKARAACEKRVRERVARFPSAEWTYQPDVVLTRAGKESR